MNKHSYLSKNLIKIRLYINSLIIKNSKKFNFSKKIETIIQSISAKRLFVAVFAFILLTFSYLSIPFFYSKTKIQHEIKNQLLEIYNINFLFSDDMEYNFFPWPSYTFENVKILNDNIEKANLEKLKINLNIQNFFSLKDLQVKDIFIKDAKFEIYKNNVTFFLNILENDLSKSGIKILDSYIFFKDTEDEVLLINKINEMNYYYDPKQNENILIVQNEIFNIPYSLEILNNKKKEIIFSKIKINLFKFIMDASFDYSKKIKKGLINIVNNKDKSIINFNINENELIFRLLDQMNNENFDYNGKIYFKPFDLELIGNIQKFKLDNFKNPNSIFVQLLKTEIFNNQNLNITSTLRVKNILPYQKLINLLLNFKIKEGLIDIDNSKFNWSDFADFKISNSLIYLKDKTLVLDGTMDVDIKKYSEIYKFFQTPRNFRKEIKKLNFIFSYNFDEEIIDISNIKIDNQNNLEVSEILKKYVSQENVLKNRIYLKNLINRALKAYSG